MLVLLKHVHQPTWTSHTRLSSDHNTACQMLAVTCQEGRSNAALKLHLSHPVSSWSNLWEIESFTFSLFGIGGNQPDVQSCLLKQSPCLGFGSWTDSQPCGMAAVVGLFKLHPGWWVAVKRAMDREFPKEKRGMGVDLGGQWPPRFPEKEMSQILKQCIKWRYWTNGEQGEGHC